MVEMPNMPYERELDIQDELMNESTSGLRQPTTLEVWASMFAGRVIKCTPDQLVAPKTKTVRYRLRSILQRLGIKRLLNRFGIDHRKVRDRVIGDPMMELRWRIVPYHVTEETVFDHYQSMTWNIPTLDPSYLFGVPPFLREAHDLNEYHQWLLISKALSKSEYDLGACYFHRVDSLGHNLIEPRNDDTQEQIENRQMVLDEIKNMYSSIKEHAHALEDECDIMIVSDHGCLYGIHTNKAYLGATFPFKAQTVLDVRQVIENRLSQLGVQRRSKKEEELLDVDYSEEDKRIIEERLRRLGYIE